MSEEQVLTLKTMFPTVDAEVISAVLEANDNNVEDCVPILLQISDPDAVESPTNVTNAANTATIDNDEAFARQLAQTQQDEDLARQMMEEEEAQQMERYQQTLNSQAAQAAMVNQAQNGTTQQPKRSKDPFKSFANKVKGVFNPSSKNNTISVPSAAPSAQPATYLGEVDEVALQRPNQSMNQ